MPSPLRPNPPNRSRPLDASLRSAPVPSSESATEPVAPQTKQTDEQSPSEDIAAPDASADAENPQQTEEHSPVEDTAAAKTPKPWKGVSHGS